MYTLINAALAILLMLGGARAAEQIEVSVDGDLVTLDVGAVPLEDVLRALGDAGGFDVKLAGDLGELQPQHLRNLPLARAVKRLTGDHGLIMRFSSDGSVLEAVQVHAASAIGASPEEREAARRRAAEQREAVLARVAATTPAPPGPPGRSGAEAGLSKSERFARVRDLSRTGDADSLAELTEVLRSDSDPALRRAAAGAIANIGGPEAADALRMALGDDERTVRVQALRGLRAADPATANAAFAEVISGDPDPSVRRAAVGLAAGLGPAGRSLLEMALNDEDETVAESAEAALQRIP